ncbi:hypothetical protein R69888_06594 [Paraburkholderia haematera]|uniref:Uncharacterized protein n=1 Tax=Paraburkholderia haematera TaxID=2793077 RepID=A0ABM8ST97_9BURK|nr:hypothetical protein R69888_06594 [Paraburkholderia haematera]
MDKNIVGYCGYSDLISFVTYRPDKAVAAYVIAALRRTSRFGAKRY